MFSIYWHVVIVYCIGWTRLATEKLQNNLVWVACEDGLYKQVQNIDFYTLQIDTCTILLFDSINM